MLNQSFIYVQKTLLDRNKEHFMLISQNACISTWSQNAYESDVFYFPCVGEDEVSAVLIEIAQRKRKPNQVLFIHSHNMVLNQAKEAGFVCIGIGDSFDWVDATYDSVPQMFEAYEKKMKRRKFFFATSLVGAIVSIATLLLYPNDARFVIGGVVGFCIFLIAGIYFYPNSRFLGMLELLSEFLIP